MLKQEDGGGGAGSKKWARTCDSCRSAACTVYCKADSAYLCNGCDARIHAVNKLASRHERVWVCGACERAPAAFLCKADAASLCTTCDSDIHSANPLARRHQRVPILPIAGTIAGAPASEDNAFLMTQDGEEAITDEDEAASWLLLEPEKNSDENDSHQHGNNSTNGMQFDGEVVDDEYLDLVDYMSGLENQFVDSCNNERQQYNYVDQKGLEGAGVVPAARFREEKDQNEIQQQHYQSFHLGLQYDGYPPSNTYNVSVSCMNVGVVPESEITEISSTHERSPKGTIDLFSSPPVQIAQQLSPMDREARVLRYREKKKMRKFEKTIRYASRKAYAETRPRIKGRFAKRTDVDVEVDQMFSDAGFGIVPSF